MSTANPNPSQVVGISPWLPWPLSAWSWSATPVRAERLAALRIGVALTLLWDVAYNYAPETSAFFGKDGLGDALLFDWYFKAERANWSLLRGFSHEGGMQLAMLAWILTTIWIVATSGGRALLMRRDPPPNDRTGVALSIWSCAFTWYVGCVWTHMLDVAEITPFAWVLPLFGFSLACLFFALDLVQRLRDASHRIGWLSALFSFAVVGVLLGVGWVLATRVEIDPDADWAPLFKIWSQNDTLLTAFMCAWLGSAFLLLIGCWTRVASIAAWMITLSFANANSYLDNAGDTIKLILLFYVMLCPCGAVWSVDALIVRRRGPVYVHPWPMRLLFVQMIFIYFMNGYYKLFSTDWQEGMSLYYVLGDVTTARISRDLLPISYEMTQLMTWSVLIWEVTFPFMVVFKWTRWIALFFGVMFHLGIFATMELGPFVPFALCMYLPLLPWERLSRRREEVDVIEIVDTRLAAPGSAG